VSEPQVLSFSSIRDWKRCRQLWYYRRVEGLRKRTVALPLKRGSLIHLLLETWLKGEDWENTLAGYAKEFDSLTEEEKEYYGDLPGEAHRIIRGYINHYKDEVETSLAVELSFGSPEDPFPPVEILPGVFLRGRIDHVVENPIGVWVQEHKTVGGQIPSESYRLFDLQTAIYSKVLPLLGYPEPVGIVFDYIKTKPPSVPQMTKQGRLSRAKIVTDHATYLQAILDNGLDPADYQEELRRASQQRFYVRKYLPKPSCLVESLLEDLRIIAAEMRRLKNFPYRNLTRECSFCEYEPLCSAELLNLDTEFLLKTEYMVSSREEDEKPDEDGENDGDD